MKKFLEIMALAAVLVFTAFTGYRQDIREREREIDIKRGLLLYGDLLLTQESETERTMEIYRCHPNERISEEVRRFTLQKSTGELEIWDSLDDSAYEKSMEYLADNRPAYVVVKGDDGTGEKEGEHVTLMEILYIYRDDGTLYDRHYRHNLCRRGCADHHNDTVLLRGKA